MAARSNVVRLDEKAARKGTRRAIHLSDSAVEAVLDQIKALIDSRNLGIGDPLPSERELGEMFMTSRTTVREAMRILKAYGVVDVRPKVGAVIIDRRVDAVFDLYSFNTLELSRQTFLDTQGFRQLIEIGAVDQLFDKAGPVDIAELRAINEAMDEAMSQGQSIHAAAQHDYRFHARLVSILGNRQIDEIYRIMKPVMLKIMENRVTRMKSHSANFTEHAGIVDALEGRNRLAYKYRMSQHLEAGLALLKE